MATAVELSARRKRQLWADRYFIIKTEKRSQLGMLASGYSVTTSMVAQNYGSLI